MAIKNVERYVYQFEEVLTLATTNVHINLKSRASARETVFAKLSSWKLSA